MGPNFRHNEVEVLGPDDGYEDGTEVYLAVDVRGQVLIVQGSHMVSVYGADLPKVLAALERARAIAELISPKKWQS